MSAQKPRLLFVGAFPPEGKQIFGGNVTDCRALMQSSFSERLELDLIDSTQISHPPPAFPVRLLLAIRRFLTFIGRFERLRPNAVLLFVAIGASVIEKGAMSWYSRLRGVPTLMFPRGGAWIDTCKRSQFACWWTKAAFGGAHKLLCQGPTGQEFAVSVLGFSHEDAPIIPNWTASGALLAIGSERIRAPRNGLVRFLFLGWLDREKGIFELLEACQHLLPAKHFMLDVVGEGNASTSARAVVDKNGLRPLVTFHGWLQGVALERVFKEADVLVLPSWAEGLPNAMVEGMAVGLAVVVTAVGNIPDVVTDGISGLLIPPRDAGALEKALARVIDDSALRIRLATAGHAIAAEQFGVEPGVTRLVSAVYASIGTVAFEELSASPRSNRP